MSPLDSPSPWQSKQYLAKTSRGSSGCVAGVTVAPDVTDAHSAAMQIIVTVPRRITCSSDRVCEMVSVARVFNPCLNAQFSTTRHGLETRATRQYYFAGIVTLA